MLGKREEPRKPFLTPFFPTDGRSGRAAELDGEGQGRGWGQSTAAARPGPHKNNKIYLIGTYWPK